MQAQQRIQKPLAKLSLRFFAFDTSLFVLFTGDFSSLLDEWKRREIRIRNKNNTCIIYDIHAQHKLRQ